MRVLIIEDEKVSLTVLNGILQTEGYEVCTATSARAALTILEGDSPVDLILLDIMMPKVNGLQFLHHLKSNLRFNKIPVIMCTSLNNFSSVAKCLECGADDYIVKPVEAKVLIEKVFKAIEGCVGSVLIVCEDKIQSEILRRSIERDGFRCLLSADGEKAWEIVQSEKIAIIVTDLLVPGISGLELLVRTKEKYPELPVVLIADSNTEQAKEAIIAAGADGFLLRPFKNTDITRRIASLVK